MTDINLRPMKRAYNKEKISLQKQKEKRELSEQKMLTMRESRRELAKEKKKNIIFVYSDATTKARVLEQARILDVSASVYTLQAVQVRLAHRRSNYGLKTVVRRANM